jgi:DNA (cytosine-5)-methyltransferase 1
MSVLLTITDTAEKIGVSIDTIRRWEKKGLIKAGRNEQNYRVFNLKEIKRLYSKINGNNTRNSRYKLLKAKRSGYTVIDLFAGAGGTALGLENAGLRHIMLNEFNKDAVQTLRLNKPDWNVVECDIANLDFKPYAGLVDIIEGGFPCQSFSYARYAVLPICQGCQGNYAQDCHRRECTRFVVAR